MTDIASLLERAYLLAYFIHPDRATAVDIVSRAYAMLPLTTSLQRKRSTYAPAEGFQRAKVQLDRAQILQYLVLYRSEPLELANERAGNFGIDDLIVGFIKQIARRIFLHNSFYACVGVTRVLCNYKTTEALDMYAFVADNRPKEDSECRRIRSRFIKALEARFGPLLTVTTTERGEKQFTPRVLSECDVSLATLAMERFTPWGTSHVIPDKYRLANGALAELFCGGKSGDAESQIELNRMHVFLDPECYGRLLRSLGIFAPLKEKLMLPEFTCTNNAGDSAKIRTLAPKLSDADVTRIAEAAKRQALLREVAAAGEIKVRVDGIDIEQFSANRASSAKIKVSSDAEIIELVGIAGGEEVVLAGYVLTDGFEQTEDEQYELDLSSSHFGLRPVPGSYSDFVLSAIKELMAQPKTGEWTARLHEWSDWLRRQTEPLPLALPPFGFIGELRAGSGQENVYDVVLERNRPLCRLEMPTSGDVLVGVERRPATEKDPLILLVPREGEGEPLVALASMDAEAGLLVARFPNVAPGIHVLCLEPTA